MASKQEAEQAVAALQPVGILQKEEAAVAAYILPQFKPALKYLHLFSHAILFYEKTDEIERSDADVAFWLDRRKINMDVVSIQRVDEVEGKAVFKGTQISHDAMLFDIKPYFPCEDRVKECKIPAYMEQWGEWRNEEAAAEGGRGRTQPDLHRIPDSVIELNHSGRIRKLDGACVIELDKADEALLQQLKDFSHIKIMWWFNRFDKKEYRRTTQCNPPYEKAPRTGIFASRSPVRPNPLALTTARILHIDDTGARITVTELDAFDRTPLIDILPYIPAFDRVKEPCVPEWLQHWSEWFDDRLIEPGWNRVDLKTSAVDGISRYLEAVNTVPVDDKSIFDKNEPDENICPDAIIVKGARQNNLKNIDVSIPKNKMTVITGVSGSGKSSLAFDTLFAESRRRFMSSLSGGGAAAFEQMEKPDFDQIIGLPPAVSIEQRNAGRNPRSTVGTLTDVYDYLRMLFTIIGTRHCPDCGSALTVLKAAEIVSLLSSLKPCTAFSVRAYNTEEPLEHFFSPSVDDSDRTSYVKRLKEVVRQGLADGNGAVVVNVDQSEDLLFQTKEMCYYCGRIFFNLSTSTFSFNNPESMCAVCKGLGVKLELDVERIVPHPELSILDGASRWWGDLRKFRQKPNANWMKGEVLALAQTMEVDLELPWKNLPDDFKQQALYGSDGRQVSFTYENTRGRRGEIVRPVEGACNIILRLFREQNGETSSRIAAEFMREKPCSACDGERLSPEGRLVTIGNTRFPQTVVMTIVQLLDWVRRLPGILNPEQLELSRSILRQLCARLENFIDAGVPYLTLDRAVPTLSGGELQRLRLACQLGSGITNILYVLDEPTTGLHQKDQSRLIKILQRLKNDGNTVLVVEHDAETMLAADKIIDIGPGAGVHGGKVVAQGTADEIMQHPDSETGRCLAGINRLEKNPVRRKAAGFITIEGARCNNLKNIDAAFPLGVLCCVSGVSGSGKSSLVTKTLFPALEHAINGGGGNIIKEFDSIEGVTQVDKILSISQQPIGRTPRSNPATYTGVFDIIRDLYASTAEARKAGYKEKKFSINSKEGQCEACNGEGKKRLDMHFMQDIWVECPVCHGKRFNEEALEIKWNGKTISDVLDMNVEEALLFFKRERKINVILQTLFDVGLGYIQLGQSALTLSGGEAQRIKLARELSKNNTGNTLYLLDEPTTGLHFSDVQNLLRILHRITAAGNSVIVIEHNPDIMVSADWMIDLGPDGGDAGGYIVAQGTPEDVAQSQDSHTAKVLQKYLVLHYT